MRLLVVTVVLLLAAAAPALEPKEVVVISNKAVPASKEVAEHYLARRKVPAANHIPLDLPTGEDISREDYEARLVRPLRAALAERQGEVKVLLTVYGVPLRVGPKVPTETEKAEITRLKERIEEARKADDKKRLDTLKQRLLIVSGDQSIASVDSELMLLWWPPYPLARWVVNPLYFQHTEERRRASPPVLMTARLDGPTPEIARRLVDDALAAEAQGLQGKAYFDARGIKFDPKRPGESGTGYEGYDESFREAATLLKQGGFNVTLDDKPELFEEGSCPDCALYAGWYRLAHYTPAFKFVKGAVAWHLASSEAVTLRDPKSRVWCPNLLRDGVAVTIGPVSEPYTVGFPKPAEFFGFLATGQYTVVECYAKTVLFTSWMGVLVGDPLYNPFAKKPLLKEAEVKPSPRGMPSLFK